MGGQSAQLDPRAHKKSKKVFTWVLLKQRKQTFPSRLGAGRRADGQTARGVGVGWGCWQAALGLWLSAEQSVGLHSPPGEAHKLTLRNGQVSRSPIALSETPESLAGHGGGSFWRVGGCWEGGGGLIGPLWLCLEGAGRLWPSVICVRNAWRLPGSGGQWRS